MKKVVFILVALMAVAFISCNSSITSPYQYSYRDESEEGEKLNYLRIAAFEEWSNECMDAHPQPHSLADSRDCPICDKYHKIFDSLDRVYKTNDTSFTSPKYDVSDVLVDFGIDKKHYQELQKYYGADHLMIEVNITKDFPKFVNLGGGNWYTKKVKHANVWIWYGDSEYDDNEFYFSTNHKIFYQEYEWNEFEMKWEEISK